jgi:hypothetical protein
MARAQFAVGTGTFLFTAISRLTLGLIYPPTQWVLRALSLRIKLPGHEVEQSLLSSAKVKNV